MNLINVLAEISKNDTISIGNGALYSLLAIVMVFAILLIIIGVTTLVFKMTGLFDMKAQVEKEKAELEAKKQAPASSTDAPKGPVEIKDDDMMAAVLVATIDYRNEIKKDVRVVSVKEL